MSVKWHGDDFLRRMKQVEGTHEVPSNHHTPVEWQKLVTPKGITLRITPAPTTPLKEV